MDGPEDRAAPGPLSPAALAGRRVLVPETRELDVLARMLERHGATALRLPLVAIHDAEDPAPVEAWLRAFVAAPPSLLVLMTGEGLRRLADFAERAGMRGAFVAALAGVRTVTRGPKPAAALRALGLRPGIAAPEPTSAGVVAALAGEALAGTAVGLQLYPEQTPEVPEALARAGATVSTVLPYRYASAAEDAAVLDAIAGMAAGEVAVVAFTSSPQVRRLVQVARSAGREALLAEGFARTRLAAVGPVVARALEAAGGRPEMMPPESFHMKPMVGEIVAGMG